jgi:hypothetical protein
MNITRFFYGIAFVALLCLTGCLHPFEGFYSHTNPVAGWKSLGWNEKSKPSPAIDEDCFDYWINLKGTVLSQDYLEDGTGQHAITIRVSRDGMYWTYVLIYDRSDKRIRVKRYISGYYGS